MKVTIPKNLCTHIKKISKYNYNYYKVPLSLQVKEKDVILEIFDEDYDSTEYILGCLDEGKFNDDGNHLRYPSSLSYDSLDGNIIIELDREGQYNT